MISEEEARKKILEAVRSLPSRQLSLSQALGCFAAEDYFARLPLPTFDNSAMDGYAVVASSSTKGARLRVTGEQPAGRDKQLRVSPGEAVRIFTGAPIPQGADAIVMQEDVTRDRDEIVINTDVGLANSSGGAAPIFQRDKEYWPKANDFARQRLLCWRRKALAM